MAVVPFSQALRERTWKSHGESESAGFMHDLMTGAGTREGYAALVAQHFFLYEALESAAEKMREDAVAGQFISDKLTRMPDLVRDLEHLLGAQWREQIVPLEATKEYVARMNEICHDWAGGFIAHHYTRYLGDLSGGQIIGPMMQRHYGIADDGVSFYKFVDIPKPRNFKDEYRHMLDSVDWTEEEQTRVIDEVILAYQFNTDLFNELDKLGELAVTA